jgi:hypothetical protein
MHAESPMDMNSYCTKLVLPIWWGSLKGEPRMHNLLNS